MEGFNSGFEISFSLAAVKVSKVELRSKSEDFWLGRFALGGCSVLVSWQPFRGGDYPHLAGTSS